MRFRNFYSLGVLRAEEKIIENNKTLTTLLKVFVGLFGLAISAAGGALTYFGSTYPVAEAAFPMLPIGIFMILSGIAFMAYDVFETVKDSKNAITTENAH